MNGKEMARSSSWGCEMNDLGGRVPGVLILIPKVLTPHALASGENGTLERYCSAFHGSCHSEHPLPVLVDVEAGPHHLVLHEATHSDSVLG